MMLNPKKYVFGVSSGKLLGYMVSSWGIDANPKKVEAIKQLQPPQTRKEIQKLAGMMAALSQFISKLGERGMPFYKLSISYYEKQMNSSGMIKRQRLSLSSSNISCLCQHWFHQSLRTRCYCMLQLLIALLVQLSPLNGLKPRRRSNISMCTSWPIPFESYAIGHWRVSFKAKKQRGELCSGQWRSASMMSN
jgi:hypothetical protein